MHFVTLYVREPHPGSGRWKDISQPETYEQRLTLARRTRSDLDATSLFLIDKMDNAIRSAYGRLPNSAYIIGRDGRVFHKQPWMDSRTIRTPLEALLAIGGRGGEKPPQFATGETRPGRNNRDASPRTKARKPASAYADAPVKVPNEAKGEIVWGHDLEKAQSIAKKAEVPVLLELHFDGCEFCEAMAKGPLKDNAVVKLSRKYVCVKIDMTTDSGEALAEKHEIVGTPAFVVFNAPGEVVLKHVNYAEADFMTSFLREGLEMTENE